MLTNILRHACKHAWPSNTTNVAYIHASCHLRCLHTSFRAADNRSGFDSTVYSRLFYRLLATLKKCIYKFRVSAWDFFLSTWSTYAFWNLGIISEVEVKRLDTLLQIISNITNTTKEKTKKSNYTWSTQTYSANNNFIWEFTSLKLRPRS